MKQVLPLERPTETPKIISVAQFRPEKVGIQILWLQGTEISRLISWAFICYRKFFVTWLFSQAHTLQLEAFSVAIGKLDADLPRPKLQFVGSCRNKSDEERLQNLKNKAVELKVDADVEFHKNITYRSVPVSHILSCFILFIKWCTCKHVEPLFLSVCLWVNKPWAMRIFVRACYSCTEELFECFPFCL